MIFLIDKIDFYKSIKIQKFFLSISLILNYKIFFLIWDLKDFILNNINKWFAKIIIYKKNIYGILKRN